MARMKYPGTNRARCAPEKKKKLNMSGRMKTQQLDQNPKSTVITPVVISLRRYREIFGDSDEEVLHKVYQMHACFIFNVLFMHSASSMRSNLICFLSFDFLVL